MASRILTIGIDGGNLELVNRFDLPHIRSLQGKGSWGNLLTVVPPVTAPAWVSFLTGRNPGKHGVFEFMRRQPDSYDLSPVNSSSIQSPTFVDIISHRGRKAVLVNVPVTYPPRPLNGLCVTGLLTPSQESEYTYPRELKREIESRIKDYVIFSDVIYAPGREEEFLLGLENQVEKRTELIRYLLDNYQWDFFMAIYNATDTVQHGLWGYTDPRSHTYDFPNRKIFASGIERIYRKVDESIGRLTARVGGETDIILMSDHGAGSLYWFLHVNIFLLRQGYLKIKRRPRSQVKLALFRLGFTLKNIYQLAYRIGLGRSRRALDAKRTRRKLLARLFLSFEDVDWKRTVAYSRGYIGQIFLNVRGREPEGIVSRGDEYRRLRERIIADLRQLVTPDGKAKLISEVYLSEDLYSGPYVDQAPDITFLTENMETVAFGNFEFSSRRVIEPAFTGISGHHRMKGMYSFSGPSFLPRGRCRDLSILDLAPLILYLLDLPVDRDMDGRVPREVIDPRILDDRPVRFEDYFSGRSELHNYRQGEVEKIVGKLQGLGYM